MPKFCKKPVVIEAVHYDERAAKHGWAEIPLWLEEAYDNGIVDNVGTRSASGPVENVHIEIKTLEGVMRADPGDWIICGVKGELYPCKPDIFSATYEAV